MSRVWVVQSNMKRDPATGAWTPKFDLTEASAFGKLEFIFGHGQAALMAPSAKAAIRERLMDFDPDDFVLPIGDNTLVFMVAQELNAAGFERVKLLRWDRQQKRYDVVTS